MQDKTNFELSDAELEGAAGGKGQWVPGSKGNWMWQTSTSSVSGGPNGSMSAHNESGSSSVRKEVINGQTHFYKFDGTKETLVGVR